ncbi:MATH domain containing protein [Histomonas meleagridis]|uniref:MATH domain containing protein n=1 Tax=Histomonas meleagridis TaxID=135588 RepID=UPI003559EF99|nr:MATH domain containing protein [Histomonas meleagridis]KAH0803889.1 MATH domain containing protein [Histomonas meleagridis]
MQKSEEHKTHKIMKISEMKEKVLGNLDQSLTKLNDSLKIIHDKVENLENLRTQLSVSYDEAQMDMFSTFRSIQSHLSDSESKCESKLSNNINTLNDLASRAEVLVDDSESILNSTDSNSISAAPRLIENIRSFVSLDTNFTIEETPTIDWTNELIPIFASYHLKIQDFMKSFRGKPFTEKYSRVVSRYNGQWRVKIVRSDGDHLGVFIELLSGFSEPAQFEYAVEIVHPHEDKHIVKSFTSLFGIMDSWGWKKLATARQLERDGYVDESDTLCLCVKLRPVSFKDAARIGEETLTKLRERYHKLKNCE